MNDAQKMAFRSEFGRLQQETYITSFQHGFQETEGNPLNVPTKIALIMSEGAEALEAHRQGYGHKLPDELADIVIRTMDLAESLQINLGEAILSKHEFNRDRPIKHGNKLY